MASRRKTSKAPWVLAAGAGVILASHGMNASATPSGGVTPAPIVAKSSNLSHRPAVLDHREHSLITLLRHTQLPHTGVSRITRSRCQPSAETLSPINRSRNVNHQPKAHRDFELATRLELVTCCLQDSCATDCATPAMPGQPTQVLRSEDSGTADECRAPTSHDDRFARSQECGRAAYKIKFRIG
jgi:hypothetical protein